MAYRSSPVTRHRSRLLLPGLSWLYTGLLGLWLLLREAFGDSLWWLALLNSGALYLFLPLALLLPLSLWQRCGRALVALGLPLALVLGLYAPLFLPRRPDPLPPNSIELTAMSFNLRFDNTDDQAIVGAIRRAAPAIVGVQELTGRRSAALTPLLAGDYPYVIFTNRARQSGVGLLSRFPLQAAAPLDLSPSSHALQARLLVEGQPLRVVVAHLSPNPEPSLHPVRFAWATWLAYRRRAEEVDAILALLDASREPALLLCDCNLTETSASYRRLASRLRDSFREAG